MADKLFLDVSKCSLPNQGIFFSSQNGVLTSLSQFVSQIPCRHCLSIISPSPLSPAPLPDGRGFVFMMDLECERDLVWGECVWCGLHMWGGLEGILPSSLNASFHE